MLEFLLFLQKTTILHLNSMIMFSTLIITLSLLLNQTLLYSQKLNETKAVYSKIKYLLYTNH